MNLKKATFFLLVGSVYTLCHKAIFALFPFLTNNMVTSNILSFLWILATFTIILFLYYFQKEVIPLKKHIKISLQFIIIFTIFIILLKLPFVQSIIPRIQRNAIFELAKLLNSIAMIVFWISFYKIVKIKYSLHHSLKLIILASSIGLLLEFIQFGYYINFIYHGVERVPFPPLHYLAIIIFLITYYALITFLIKFKKIDDYTKLVLR